MTERGSSRIIWQGSLLPAIWYTIGNSGLTYSKAKVDLSTSNTGDTSAELALVFPRLGKGMIYLSLGEPGISMDSVTVKWDNEIPLIHSLYFGTNRLTPEQAQIVPDLDKPFWNNWRADGFCIPTAKGAPIQSFFRFWQFGHATIPLGSFGPSLGTPYAAAYPRPVYSAAMGGANGWIALGSGTVMDAAMVLKIKSSSACIKYLYREDLWGGYNKQARTWKKPLIISWSTESAWDAYNHLFSHFPQTPKVSPEHQTSHWNSWGDFRNRNFNMDQIIGKAEEFEAELFTWDMLWETFECSGIANLERFPQFEKEVEKLKEKNIRVGYWQSVVWVNDYESLGLTPDDLILGKDGRPRKVNWIMSPYHSGDQHFALDPSSERTREFIRRKITRIVKEYKADLLKIDFGYGIPSPDVGVPRDPALRGENYAFTLLKLISDVAREANPDITIQYYSIHPLFKPVQNLLALDDMGDAGNEEARGHAEWSIWSALAGMQGMAVMASSGYDWDADKEVLMNTAIIGSPGLVLPASYKGGEIPATMINRRLALTRCYRKTTGWEPLWLNSKKGSLTENPALRCWGRVETINGKKNLTALTLRDREKQTLDPAEIENLDFSGDWSLISQDDHSVWQSKKLAIIPFGTGYLKFPASQPPKEISRVYRNKEEKTDFRWKDGQLIIEVPESLPETGLLGFILSF